MWKNIEAGGLLDCTALSAGKRPFLLTKYHTREKITHNSVKTLYFDEMKSSWKPVVISREKNGFDEIGHEPKIIIYTFLN